MITEYLVTKPSKKKVRYSSIHSCLFDFDTVTEVLKHIHTNSKIKKRLSLCLGTLHSFPSLILLISFFSGLLFFASPLFLLYYKTIKNIGFPLMIICIITMFFNLCFIVLRILSNKRNKNNLVSKWERKNILSNIGLFVNMGVLLASSIILFFLWQGVANFTKEKEIIVDYEDNGLSKQVSYDYLFNFLLSLFFVKTKKIDKYNYNNKIKFDITFPVEDKMSFLQKYIIYIFIPLSVFCLNKSIKVTLLEVKFQFQQIMVFFTGLFFCLLIIGINYFFYIEKIFNINENLNKIISILELIFICIIFTGLILWVVQNIFRFIGNPKDKNFAIREYSILHSFVLVILDLGIFSGYTMIFLSFLFYFVAYIQKGECYQNFKYSIIFIKIGYFLLAIGNSYYYGHNLLANIFRPIALEFAPSELKNKHYIRAKRNILNQLAGIKNQHKRSSKMRDFLLKKKN